MKQKIIKALLLLLCISMLSCAAFAQGYETEEVWDGKTSEPFSDGQGTSSNPYLISNGAQLYYLSQQGTADSYYKLTNDINLDDKPFAPISNLTGTFDGDGHSILNLNITSSVTGSSTKVGLFRQSSGTIKNLTLTGKVSGTTNNYVGAFVGQLNGGQVSNCVNRCSVEASSSGRVGGIVGFVSNPTGNAINKSANVGSVTGKSNVGGIAGYIEKSGYNSSDAYVSIIYCQNSGDVVGTGTSSSYVGGICGRQNGSTISQSVNAGTVSGHSYTGGIVGYGWSENCISISHSSISGTIRNKLQHSSHIHDCYNTGDIQGSYSGGIAGGFERCRRTTAGYHQYYSADTSLSCCYNIGIISGSEYGDIIGKSTSNNISVVTPSYCYYIEGNNANATQNKGTSCSAENMEYPATYEGFDFTSIWTWDDSSSYPYPILKNVGLPQAACDHNYTLTSSTATCTEAGVETYTCTKCGDSYTKNVSATGHTPSQAVEENEIEATCTTSGSYDEVIYCSVCETELSREQKTVPMKDHTIVTDAAVSPTCTSEGKTEGSHCSVCGTVIKAQETIPATNHSFTTKPSNKLATAATCTEPATYYVQCDNCDAIDETITVTVGNANGHTPSEAVKENEVEATCTVSGSYDEVIRCSVCKEVISSTHKTTPLKEHTIVTDAAVAPSCTSEGKTEGSHCSVCGTVIKAQETIPATNHSFTTKPSNKLATAATCTEPATYYVQCDNCDAISDTVTIPVGKALGHDFSNNVEYCANGCGTKNPNYIPSVPDLPSLDIPHKPSTNPSNKPSTNPEEPDNPFIDMDENEYYYDAVIWAYNNGITSGYTNTTFEPLLNCTRAQVVTFIWRAYDSPEPQENENTFTDVVEGAYYEDAVQWAVENGITEGTTSTTFSPDDIVTRAQVVTFLWRAAGKPSIDEVDISFEDVSEDSYYSDAVKWAVANDITNGTSETTFSPYDECTRAQIVTFLYRHFAEQ